jgi:hypothetical protein
VGLVQGSQIYASQGSMNVALEQAVGRQLVVELTAQSWKDKQTGELREKVGISYAGFFSMRSPEAAACPQGVIPGMAAAAVASGPPQAPPAPAPVPAPVRPPVAQPVQPPVQPPVPLAPPQVFPAAGPDVGDGYGDL